MPKKAPGNKPANESSADIIADDTNAKEAPSKSAAGKRMSALQPRTADDIANEQTAEQLALRIWAATIGATLLSDISALADELLTSSLFDDDDEEGDDEGGWFDDRHEREKKLLDEAIADGLDKFPDINAVSNLSLSSDPDPDPEIVQAADQLKDILAKCAIGATEFKKKFSRGQLERLIKLDLAKRLKKDQKYSEHVRGDVPGSNIKKHGSRGRTSSRGTFTRAQDFVAGGGLDALFTGGWMRVCRDRIEPVAWSYRHGHGPHGESWWQHYDLIDRKGRRKRIILKRTMLVGSGHPALKELMDLGAHLIHRKGAYEALVTYLRYPSKHEIVRMSRVGWAEVGTYLVFVRHDEVIVPPSMSKASNTTYELESTAIDHGLHVAGTTKAWCAEIAVPLRGNSNVALSFGTFFGSPLLRFAIEPGGGWHFYGTSNLGKSMASALGQSIYGWPYETADDAFGTNWEGSAAGFDAFLLARTDVGLGLDEITRADPLTAEAKTYMIASGTKGPRSTPTGRLRETPHASLLALSTGEKSLPQFIGERLQEGARKRLVDVPAEVQPSSAFETIPSERINSEGKRLYAVMKRQHGAVGRDWQRYLVNLGPDQIKAQLHQHREAFAALPEVAAVDEKAHPQVRAVVDRFALCAAALRMAIAADLLPWSVEEADAGIVACMQRWVAQRGNVNTAGELQRAAAAASVTIRAALSDRFITIYKPKRSWEPATEADEIKQRSAGSFDGYVKTDQDPDQVQVLVRSEAWPRYCNGADPHEVAKHLQERGTLIPGSDGKLSKAEQVIGKVERFYVLSLTRLTP